MIDNMDSFAEIQFLPVCSKCRTIIRGKVDIKYSQAYSLSYAIKNKECDIYPYKCECCGRIFKMIALPTALPYYA